MILKTQHKIWAIVALTTIALALTVGELVTVPGQPLSSQTSSSSEKPPQRLQLGGITAQPNNLDDKQESSTSLLIGNQDSDQKIQTGHQTQADSQSTDIDSNQPIFQVKTDYGYECTEGDPKEAIQNAIYSLPDDRLEPLNIYLTGRFDPVYDIVLESNIHFIGNEVQLVIDQHESIFILNQSRQYYEVYSTLEIDGRSYTDWVTLHNVTFSSIIFTQSPDISGCGYAINFFDVNSTGWGVSDRLNIYGCEFDGFINAVQGLSYESEYVNNYFHDYSNNGLLLLYGLNITIQDNVFDSSVSPISIEEYTSIYGPGSMIGRIGLFLLDVCQNVLVSNNIFIEGVNSTGIAFSSSIGNFLVTNNSFVGEGTAYLIDFNLRPFLSAGIIFSSNVGANDFRYDYGEYVFKDEF